MSILSLHLCPIFSHVWDPPTQRRQIFGQYTHFEVSWSLLRCWPSHLCRDSSSPWYAGCVVSSGMHVGASRISFPSSMLWTEWYYSSYKWRNWSMIQTLEICHGYRPYYQFVHAVLFQRNVGDMWLSNVMLVLMLHVIIWSHVCRGIVITENLWRRICKNKIHTLQQQVTTTIINNTQTHTKLTHHL